MTDQELLELAAKAAGYEWRTDIDAEREKLGLIALWIIDPMKTAWNPLNDDGDAMRLAAKLHLWEAVRLAHREVSADTDIYAATRRAIVRAAAEVGKQMGEVK